MSCANSRHLSSSEFTEQRGSLTPMRRALMLWVGAVIDVLLASGQSAKDRCMGIAQETCSYVMVFAVIFMLIRVAQNR